MFSESKRKGLIRDCTVCFCILVLIIIIGNKIRAYGVPTKAMRFEHMIFKSNGEGKKKFEILSVLQDKKGFMWLGTNDGLMKYDGKSTKLYRPYSPISVYSNRISNIIQSRDGMLWMSTGKSFASYDVDKNKFKLYILNPTFNKKHKSKDICSICEDKEGYIWVLTVQGVYRLDRTKGKFKVYTPKYFNNKGLNLISDVMCLDKKGQLWIGGCYDILYKYDRKLDKFIKYYPNSKHIEDINRGSIISIQDDSRGRLWMGTGEGLQYIDTNNGDVRRKTTFHGTVFSIHPAETGKLWLGTCDQGLIKYDIRTGNYEKFDHNKYDKYSISGNNVSGICEDRIGNLWLITDLMKLDKLRKQRFESYIERKNKADDMQSSGYISAIYKDYDGNVWIAKDGGLYELNRFTQKYNLIKYEPLKQNAGRSFHCISQIYEDKQHNIWIGIDDKVYNLQPKLRKLIRCKIEGLGEQEVISCFFEDSNNRLWAGTGCGIWLYDKKEKAFKKYIDHHVPFTEYDDTRFNGVTSICEGKKGELWFSTYFGLFKINTENKKLKGYLIPDDRNIKGAIKCNELNCVYRDHTGTIWIGAKDNPGKGGLYRYDEKRDKFKYFTVQRGFNHLSVSFITEDKKGTMWLHTNRGAATFDRKTGHFSFFEKENLLTTDDSSYGYGYISKDNEIFFNGYGAFISFKPENLLKKSEPTSVYITGFEVFDKDVNLHKDISSIKKINIPYYKDFIRFRFAALDLTEPNKNQYEYKLEGVDKKWIKSGNRNEAVYIRLAPGTYTFRVKASNNEGVWNKKGTSVKLVVTAPFWKTDWKYLIYLLVLLSFLCNGFFVWTKCIRKNNIS